jgi:uncharacterized lipoprotein YmbA
MKNRLFQVSGIFVLGMMCLMSWGCASSPPTKFYLLSPLSEGAPGKTGSAGDPCLSVAIGPVQIPEYIDRPQIVTRISGDEIALAEFHRWAEPLQNNLKRLLADTLSGLLCTKAVVFYPRKGVIPLDYRVEMEVVRFDGSLGGKVSLDAWWTIRKGDGKEVLVTRRTALTEAVDGQGYPSLVAAQSRAARKLDVEIADAIKTLPR